MNHRWKFVLVVAGLAGAATAAQADLIKYTFNAEFEDGNIANGTFLFDSLAVLATDLVLNTSGGSTYSAANITNILGDVDFGDQYAFWAVDPSNGPDYTDDIVLNLRFFTDGDLLNPIVSFTDLGSCSDSNCNGRNNIVNVISVSLTGVVVPLPPAAFGGLAMLAGLGAYRRVRK
jgi:hypothetical protein